MMAFNDEARSRGVPEARLHQLMWWQRNAGYLATFGLPRIAREKAAREAAEQHEHNV
jgi:hypothetical protein